MTTKTIKIQYLDDSIQRLTYVGGKSDWIDLAAAETVTLKADGSTSVAGKLGATSVSATGCADVSGLSEGVIYADFAPVVSEKEGTKTVKRVLSLRLNLWFDRAAHGGEVVGTAHRTE